MKTPRSIFLIIGILSLAHFAITGALMKFRVYGPSADDTLERALFRSNHIYIVFAGLVNMLVFFSLRGLVVKGRMHNVALVLLLVGTAGINLAFYSDPVTHSLQRNLTRFSVIACFAGSMIHLLLLHARRRREAAEE